MASSANEASRTDFHKYIKPLSLFFFFATMNENKAIHLTVKVIDRLKKLNPHQDPETQMVKIATEYALENSSEEIYITKNISEYWILAKDLELGPWKEFHKKVELREIISLIWSHVIKLDEAKIVEGLNITVGTHRYRVMNALKNLGSSTYLLK